MFKTKEFNIFINYFLSVSGRFGAISYYQKIRSIKNFAKITLKKYYLVTKIRIVNDKKGRWEFCFSFWNKKLVSIYKMILFADLFEHFCKIQRLGYILAIKMTVMGRINTIPKIIDQASQRQNFLYSITFNAFLVYYPFRNIAS